ncbi:MAG TPA: methyltransferase domain-containing protein, partial [Myxococcota bacterium]|nr:methyltransferase domain-containing protein [Myxococcota bacterium]
MTHRYQSFRTKKISARKLVGLVVKHATTTFQRPFPDHQIDAFNQIAAFLARVDLPLIIDSGCGTGLSSQKLATLFPDHAVVGIDKSENRLQRAIKPLAKNLLLVRGELSDLWRLLASAELSVARHYLLFPNPWPKACQIKRRFYAHPVFKTMASLAPYFELRTNWLVYAEECALALTILGHNPVLSIKTDRTHLTLFEK